MSETDFDYHQLDTIIHSRIRLMIMSVLLSIEKVNFNYLKEQTKSTDGNLSRHLTKLEEVNYLESEKSFVNKKPRTTYKLTSKGRTAMKKYVKKLKKIIKI